MKTKTVTAVTTTPTYAEVEANCKRLIRNYRNFMESADKVKAELTEYANKYAVTRPDLIQWLREENFSWKQASNFAYDIIRVVDNATTKVKEGLASGEITFKEARESVTIPTKTPWEKRETEYERLLREAAKKAVLNEVDEENFAQKARTAHRYAEGMR